MGDIHVLDGIVHKHKVYDDVVVEVTGETKKRAARIYYGQHGHSQLRLELQLLSKLYPHPRIRQVFGIFKCNDTTGLVFHDDGTHQRHRDYMVSLQPLQRATFSIKYMADYIDTFEYLRRHLKSLSATFRVYKDIPIVRVGAVRDQLELVGWQLGSVDCYVDSRGNLNAVLSIFIRDFRQDTYNHYQNIGNTWNTERPPVENLSQRDCELIHKILNNDSFISTSQLGMSELISICHRTFLSVMKTRIIMTHQCHHNIECFLGHPVIVWPGPVGYHFYRIHYLYGHFEGVHQNINSNSWYHNPEFFDRESSCANQFTCFKLKADAITPANFINADNRNISFSNYYSIFDDTFYHNWLYQAPQILESHAFIHNNNALNYLGIVSGVTIVINITICSSIFIHYMENNPDTEIYLFISDWTIDPLDGRVSEPDIYWSLDKSGRESLTEYSAALRGLSGANITLNLEIRYWDKFYYDALCDLYKMCRITTSDGSDVSQHIKPSKFKLNKQEQRRKSYLYTEDIGATYLKTEHERVKHEERLSWPYVYWYQRSSYAVDSCMTYSWVEERYSTQVKSPNISHLSWIGITILEDCFRQIGTVLETRYVRNKQRKYHETFIAECSHAAYEEDWENITCMDVDSGDSDW
ncbi:hypothetical protein BDQ17DRAFT_1413326, partial [Cyathus striatus]